jgi:type II secretory pathway predicted ATPase ExeA
MSYLTLHHFKLPADTFSLCHKTGDLEKVSITVNGAIANKSFASIIGPRGVGKSSAVAGALPTNAQVVLPLTLDRERLRIGAIEDAIVYDLSSESPKRSAEARTRQIRPILGEAAKKGPVVLVIEEAHRMHSSTIRALKSLAELKWMGRGPLLSIVLIGQKDPLAMPSMEEVALRANKGRLVMAGLSGAEAMAYIRATVGGVWSDEAITAIATSKMARNFLDLQDALIMAMDQALAEGRKNVELSDVFHATGVGLKEMLEKAGIAQAEIARSIGKSASETHRIITGERENPEAKERIRRLLEERAGKGKAASAEPARKVANG